MVILDILNLSVGPTLGPLAGYCVLRGVVGAARTQEAGPDPTQFIKTQLLKQLGDLSPNPRIAQTLKLGHTVLGLWGIYVVMLVGALFPVQLYSIDPDPSRQGWVENA